MPLSSDCRNLVTFEELAGYRAVHSFGYISGSASRARNRLRSTFRSLGMLIGLAGSELLSDAEQLRAEALEALRRRANSLGADAVIGLQFYVTEGGDGSCQVVASGKAVALSKVDPA
ncbi:MAG TPA: heavy metal-binding domain-containing protein [Candidatus Cybelea sp.]|nr:heavy metal-binding domain-containing protein [Candidatus Cybelea sp.]